MIRNGRVIGAIVAVLIGMALVVIGTFYTPVEFWARTSLFGVGLVSCMCGLVLSKDR